MDVKPKIAIIDHNTLAVLGLKSVLDNAMPFATIETFGSFAELAANHPEQFFHYFVAMDIVLENHNFFYENRHKVIVMTMSTTPDSQMQDFHYLNVNIPEDTLIKSLLRLEQMGHAHGENFPKKAKVDLSTSLSHREIEVISLIALGYTNKEMADKLNIGVTTVITHRKNLQSKLNLKSVGALTIYAVMHGYVDINKI